jgi:MFS superfamily sulfate permease-like transporter
MRPSIESQKKKSKQWIDAPWLALGIGVGTALGVALHNLAVGVGLGTAIGILFSVIRGRKNSDNCGEANEDVGAQSKE